MDRCIRYDPQTWEILKEAEWKAEHEKTMRHYNGNLPGWEKYRWGF